MEWNAHGMDGFDEWITLTGNDDQTIPASWRKRSDLIEQARTAKACPRKAEEQFGWFKQFSSWSIFVKTWHWSSKIHAVFEQEAHV